MVTNSNHERGIILRKMTSALNDESYDILRPSVSIRSLLLLLSQEINVRVLTAPVARMHMPSRLTLSTTVSRTLF